MKEDRIGILALSRYGDIINALPIAKHFSAMAPVDFIVASEFADILEGVSYVTPVISQGNSYFQDTQGAMGWAMARWPRFVNAQVFNNPNMSRTRLQDFCEEQYWLAGVSNLYGKFDPVFDKRDLAREAAWLAQFDLTRPVIAYNLTGHSAPLPGADKLERAFISRFGDTCTLVNTSAARPHRIFDLLAILDMAKIFVTIDTATLHLAKASKVPTIEIVPTVGAWNSAPAGPRCCLRMGHGDVPSRIEEILRTVAEAMKPPKPGKTWHLVNTYVSKNPEDARRTEMAEKTWKTLYSKGWSPCHIRDQDFSRSSRDLGDSRRLPFIRDLIDKALAKAGPNDTIVLTNNDTCIVESAPEDLAKMLKDYGCALTNRYDFDKVSRPMDRAEVLSGRWYCGLDLFAFTKKWWLQWGCKYPDMILGCEAWDHIMSELMILSTSGAIPLVSGIIYHEKHDSFWERSSNRYSNPGQVWARKCAHDWLAKWKSKQEANSNFPQPIPFISPDNERIVAIVNNPPVVAPSRAETHAKAGLASETTPTTAFVAYTPPVTAYPQTQASVPPVTRGQTAAKLKAKLRTPDGSRVHLFSDAPA